MPLLLRVISLQYDASLEQFDIGHLSKRCIDFMGLALGLLHLIKSFVCLCSQLLTSLAVELNIEYSFFIFFLFQILFESIPYMN